MTLEKEVAVSVSLSDSLRPIAEQIAALSEDDRRRVIEAVESGSRPMIRPMSWDLFDKAKGIVTIGGNALEDCDALHDG